MKARACRFSHGVQMRMPCRIALLMLHGKASAVPYGKHRVRSALRSAPFRHGGALNSKEIHHQVCNAAACAHSKSVVCRNAYWPQPAASLCWPRQHPCVALQSSDLGVAVRPCGAVLVLICQYRAVGGSKFPSATPCNFPPLYWSTSRRAIYGHLGLCRLAPLGGI